MIEWWNNLEPLAKFFWCVALAGSLFQIFLFAASFLGGDFDNQPFRPFKRVVADEQ